MHTQLQSLVWQDIRSMGLTGEWVDRCVAVLVYSPEEKKLKENLQGWVQLIAAKSPGAEIVVVSTHSKSAKLEGSVEKLAKEMEVLILSELQVVNQGVAEEASRLMKKIFDLRERLDATKDADGREEFEKGLGTAKERL